ncbi:Frataxin [Diplonema papillatum]|nr:Frataxin [Diplonema papillatum]
MFRRLCATRGVQARFSSDVAMHVYARAVQNTLDVVCDVLDEKSDRNAVIEDVAPSSGVLEIVVENVGTYILNRQEPKKQLWMSSPLSGPSQFSMCIEDGAVVWRDYTYKRELYSLLSDEFKSILKEDVAFPPVLASSA